MIYLLYGKENLILEKKINEILKKEKIEACSVNNYDLEDTLLTDILEDASMLSMFGDKKGIVVFNSYIFTGSTKKTLLEQNTDILLNYLDNPNPDTVLIFVIETDKIDERKKITKQLRKNGTVFELTNQKNTNALVKEMFDDYNIDNATIQLLIDRVGDNLRILEQECEKIKTYKDSEKNITKDDVLALTAKNIDIDIFKLIENIVSKNKKEALEAYHEMLKRNEEPIKIIIMLANQFRLMYQAKELSKKGYTQNDIASELDVHPYRVKLALEKSRNFSSSTLLKHIENLANLDYDIKSGMVDKGLALDLFILEI